MAENVFLQSKAKGSWGYEVVEDKIKTMHYIKCGLNEIPASHMKVIEDDPGFKAMCAKKIYHILNKKELKKAEKEDSKSIDNATEVSEVKKVCKDEIAQAKKDHVAEMKAERVKFNVELQTAVTAKGEALQQVKDLEADKLTFDGQIAQLKAGGNKDVEILKIELADLKAENEKQVKGSEVTLLALKTESQKQIKALEGVNESLEKKVKDQKEELKKAK